MTTNADFRIAAELRAVAAYRDADCHHLDHALARAKARHGNAKQPARQRFSLRGYLFS